MQQAAVYTVSDIFELLPPVYSENYAKHWCSMLRSSDSTFAKCHAMVDPELYYKVIHFV